MTDELREIKKSSNKTDQHALRLMFGGRPEGSISREVSDGVTEYPSSPVVLKHLLKVSC